MSDDLPTRLCATGSEACANLVEWRERYDLPVGSTKEVGRRLHDAALTDLLDMLDDFDVDEAIEERALQGVCGYCGIAPPDHSAGCPVKRAEQAEATLDEVWEENAALNHIIAHYMVGHVWNTAWRWDEIAELRADYLAHHDAGGEPRPPLPPNPGSGRPNRTMLEQQLRQAEAALDILAHAYTLTEQEAQNAIRSARMIARDPNARHDAGGSE